MVTFPCFGTNRDKVQGDEGELSDNLQRFTGGLQTVLRLQGHGHGLTRPTNKFDEHHPQS